MLRKIAGWLRGRGRSERGHHPRRCAANSGLFIGYRCSLVKGHVLPHSALITTTTDGLGREVGRRTITWPSPPPSVAPISPGPAEKL